MPLSGCAHPHRRCRSCVVLTRPAYGKLYARDTPHPDWLKAKGHIRDPLRLLDHTFICISRRYATARHAHSACKKTNSFLFTRRSLPIWISPFLLRGQKHRSEARITNESEVVVNFVVGSFPSFLAQYLEFLHAFRTSRDVLALSNLSHVILSGKKPPEVCSSSFMACGTFTLLSSRASICVSKSRMPEPIASAATTSSGMVRHPKSYQVVLAFPRHCQQA
jgi:hypothetical protein